MSVLTVQDSPDSMSSAIGALLQQALGVWRGEERDRRQEFDGAGGDLPGNYVSGSEANRRPESSMSQAGQSESGQVPPLWKAVVPTFAPYIIREHLMPGATSSTGSLLEEFWFSSYRVPSPTIAPSAKPYITDRVNAVLVGLTRMLAREARRQSVVVARVDVDSFTDPDEGFHEIVVSQCVRLSASEALDYWDRLGVSLQNWIEQLPAALKKIARNRIAVEVNWDTDDLSIL